MSIVETMRVVAQREMHKLHLPTLGVVTSIFPHASKSDKDNYECNVRLKNTELELRRVPVSTQCIGLAGIPHIGDLVIIVFLNGDINAPIIVGRLYNDEDRPPSNKDEEIVYVPPYSANSEKRRIYLEFPQGMIFKITDDEVNIKTGDTKVIVKRDGDVVIESKANVNVIAEGDATLKSKGKMSILGESIKIESDKKLEMTSGSDMNLNAAQGKTTIESSSGMDVKTKANMLINAEAGSATIKSTAGMNVETTAIMQIKGSVVNIN